MNKLIYSILFTTLLICSCQRHSNNNIDPQQIYLFYFDACPHCHDAQEFINKKYPHLHINKIDVNTPRGYQMFLDCAAKHNLGKNIGTPLFCMGKNYIMGWSKQSAGRFNAYVKPFLK